jgi:hypothetical protein
MVNGLSRVFILPLPVDDPHSGERFKSNLFKECVNMKVKLNPAFEEMSGTLGEMVFRELRGETIVSRKSSLSGEPTANQAAHRERFKLAAAYGKSVMADPAALAI